jgi:hypothetical protein
MNEYQMVGGEMKGALSLFSTTSKSNILDLSVESVKSMGQPQQQTFAIRVRSIAMLNYW